MSEPQPGTEQEPRGPLKPKREPPRKTPRWVFITGATQGIGYHTASSLAKRGDRVILGARTQEKGDAARKRILEEAPDGDIRLAVGDLSTAHGVRRVAQAALGHSDRIDVLILNAGLSQPKRSLSEDGVEMTFAVNHLSTHRMAKHMHEALRKGDEPRVIIVSSHAHRSAKLDLDDVERKNRRFSGWSQYCNTKLMNLLLMNELARRWREDGITVNAVHPGVVNTGIARNWWFGRFLFRILGRTPKQGADTLIYLAIDPIGRKVTAQYFADRNPLSPRRAAFDEHLQAKLWRISESYGD